MRILGRVVSALLVVAAVGCGGAGSGPVSSSGKKGVETSSFKLTVRGETAVLDPSTSTTIMLPGGGLITSSAGGIDCGIVGATLHKVCAASFPYGTTGIVLTAAPDTSSGYQYYGFAGACGLGTCSVNITSDRLVVVRFAKTEAGLGSHPNFTDPALHVPLYRDFVADVPGALQCSACHGANLQGQGLAVGCFGCHATISTPCAVANGTGTMPWNGTTYGACIATLCDPGYHVDDGACARDAVNCGDLTETGILQHWSSYAPGFVTTLSVLDSPDVVRGQHALRAVTGAGFDFAVVYSEPTGTTIDASGFEFLRFAVRGLNTTPLKWQVNSPIIVLQDLSGHRRQYAPATNLLNSDGVNWVGIAVPLAGDALWAVSGQAVDLAAITRIEIHTDTWDYGFTIDVDALSFDHSGATCPISKTGN